MRTTALLIALYSLLTAPVAAVEFLQHRTAHSLNGLFGIPSPVSQTSGNTRLQLGLVHSNMFASGIDGDSRLFLDGERTRLALRWSRPLSRCLGAAADLPLIAHADGYFDRAIEDWHGFFGLPNAGREEIEPNNLNVTLLGTGGESLQVEQAQADVGDVTLTLQWSPGCLKTQQPATPASQQGWLRLGLKLPTGRLETLSGSGETDLFVDYTTRPRELHQRVHARASFGLLLPGQVESFTQQRDWALFGSAVAAFAWSPEIALIGQLDWHTPLFDTGLTEIGDAAVLFSTGIRWHRASGTFDFAIVEDVAPDTGPDISVLLSWQSAIETTLNR